MKVRLSRSLIINSLCCAIGVLIAINVPWWVEAYRVLPPFIEEIWRCVELGQR